MHFYESDYISVLENVIINVYTSKQETKIMLPNEEISFQKQIVVVKNEQIAFWTFEYNPKTISA